MQETGLTSYLGWEDNHNDKWQYTYFLKDVATFAVINHNLKKIVNHSKMFI